MQVGVIGAGTIFESHVGAHRECGAIVSAVADVDAERAAAAAQQFGIPRATGDWREVLDRDDIDVVDICTPPQFHAEIAIAALLSGKHVICEKPLAGNLREIDAILAAQRKSSAQLCVCHQFRYLPFYQRMKWLIDAGHLGDVHFARVQRYDPPPKHLVTTGAWGSWQMAGGGVLMTKAIHQLDMLLGLLGPARRVQAMMGTFLCPIESEDHLTANIEFENGALANVTVSGQAYGGYGQHFDVFGSKAAVGQPWHIRNVDGSYGSQLVSELEMRFPELGAAPTSGWKYFVRRIGWKFGRDFFPALPSNMHAPLFREFFDALERGRPCPVTAEDGRAAVELCTAIYQSAISKESVELPLCSNSTFYDGIQKNDYSTTIAGRHDSRPRALGD